MPSHKTLKSVARSLADSFTSLMNFAGDDYVMGHAVLAAWQTGATEFRVDLLTGSPTHPFHLCPKLPSRSPATWPSSPASFEAPTPTWPSSHPPSWRHDRSGHSTPGAAEVLRVAVCLHGEHHRRPRQALRTHGLRLVVAGKFPRSRLRDSHQRRIVSAGPTLDSGRVLVTSTSTGSRHSARRLRSGSCRAGQLQLQLQLHTDAVSGSRYATRRRLVGTGAVGRCRPDTTRRNR